jgi:anhydro-N-acetylmuramic acid kinase
MNKLPNILRKRSRTVLGILSGTSVDAVDIVLTCLTGNGLKMKIEILGYIEFKIPLKLRNYVLRTSDLSSGTVEDVCKLNVILGQFYSRCILSALKSFGFKPENVDLIGSHGQTIYHIPWKKKSLGFNTNSTLQIGDPSVIANCTGITTVGDFRISDVGAGGSGAPLVPYLDFVLYADKNINRILLNIGGISNITILPAGVKFGTIKAFDTGPGNMMIDFLTYKFFEKPFDKDAKLALKGNINSDLFNSLRKRDKYYSIRPPKSTGREYYNGDFIEKALEDYNKLSAFDILRTFTEYTAYTVAYNINKYSGFDGQFELIISGGGAHNPILSSSLGKYMGNAKITNVDKNGITTDNKEAVLFAVLANEAVSGIPANLMAVTGSRKKAVLGKICQVVENV